MQKNHRIIIILIILVPILSCFLPKGRNVAILDGDKCTLVRTAARDVRELLQEKGIKIKEGDRVDPQPETPLTSGLAVRIKREKSVDVIASGKKMTIMTAAATVKEALKEAGIEPGVNDRVVPGLEEAYTDSIQIVSVETKIIAEQVTIPYTVKQIPDNGLYKGEQRIKEKGRNGLEKYVYEVVLEDGKEIARKLIEKLVVQKPVQQVVAVGERATVSRGGKPLNFKQVLKMTATAYTHTGNRTCTDIWPSVGIVAVDPSVIPLGTRLYIDGYGNATALDRGSAIKGNRIDLFFENKAEALKWGRRTVRVFILE